MTVKLDTFRGLPNYFLLSPIKNSGSFTLNFADSHNEYKEGDICEVGNYGYSIESFLERDRKCAGFYEGERPFFFSTKVKRVYRFKIENGIRKQENV